jgi:transglutaminase-like putative cysteine protease
MTDAARTDRVPGADRAALCKETFFLNHGSADMQEFISATFEQAPPADPVDRAVILYYAVRDGIDYDVYDHELSRDSMRASSIVRERRGFCIHKSLVYAAALRAVGVPSKLVFADVRNHLASARLKELIGGEVFSFHAMTKAWLAGRWVTATPVFNKLLCQLYGFPALDFDGSEDSVLHPFGAGGDRSMEFLEHRGEFADFPYDTVISGLRLAHPLLFRDDNSTTTGSLITEGPPTGPTQPRGQ